jgi:putative MATE family efflux protein
VGIRERQPLTVVRATLARLALNPDASARVIRLAYPVVLGMTSFTLLSFVDTAMLGRIGAAPLAASGIAGVLVFGILFTLAGIGIGVQTVIARRFGEGNLAECGAVVHAGLVLACLLALPLTIASPWLARLLAPFQSADPQVVSLVEAYLHYRLYGALFMISNWVFRGFFAGIGETRHQMVASIITTAVNIVLDYLLIFGHAGFPRLEITGAAIASTVAIAAGTLYLASVAVSKRPFSVRKWTGRITRLSLPVAGQRLLSNGSWYLFFLIVSRIGTVELAASTAIRSVYHLTIMLGVGIGTAAAALVGQQLGARKPERAERLGWEAAKLSALSMGLAGILFLAIPGLLMRIYTPDPEVISAGRAPLFLLGLVQAFAGVALVLSQALQGAGNTRFVMFAELGICGSLYLPVVYVLGLRMKLGLIGAWAGEFIYWTALAAIMSWKFARGGWKRIIV